MKPVLLLLLAAAASGCARKPPLAQAGFLDDYSMMEKVGDNRMIYVSPRLGGFTSFIIEPLEFTVPPRKLDEDARARLGVRFRERLIEEMRAHDYQVLETAGDGVARVRMALTDVANSTWWQKVHPGMRLTGAGTGGASAEGEITDSVTGEQLAAWVVADAASQFDFTAFSTAADVMNVMDKWTAEAVRRLDALRRQAPTQQ
jgi:hypothetical protein